MKSRAARQAVLLVAASLLSTLAGPAVWAMAGEPPQAVAVGPDESGHYEPVADALLWLSSLEEGLHRATADRKPLLVRAGAAWCPVCREQEEQFLDPKVQEELHCWTRVYVDVDQSPGDAEQLNVSVVPALRIRSPGGWTVAARDGYVSAEDLVAWLGEHYETALAAPDDVLLESGSPDAAAVADLVRQFSDRSPAVREAAIRRLLPHPEAARAAVVEGFRGGSLAVRLTALELLREWRAPVEGIDPWRPDTINEERLTALEKWRGETGAEPPAQPEELTPDELASAQREIERMLKSTDTEAGAIRERLARLGASLMPEVYARLSAASTDQDRERLLALRYRLVADGSLVLRWPGGIARLAATDSRQRQQAAEELAQLATGSDQPLLLEMFSDPDPLVREISLRGLQHIGGKEATAALVELLADPEPNVRAAVLKQLEEDPRESMVPKVVQYLTTEKDPDLIVHAIRFLRATGGEQSLKCLMTLLDHESWQVRAEAAAGVGNTDAPFRGSFSGYDPFGGGEESTALRADACAALLERLDDPDAFVVSRAVEGLAQVDMAVAVEPLAKAAEQHPELAASIVEILANGEQMRPKALPYLRRFSEHADAGIRAAAIGGLARAAPRSAEKALAAGLRDPESTVRTAAASALFELFERHRSAAASAMEQERSSGGLGTVSGYYGGPADPFGTEAGGNLISRMMRMLRGAPSLELASEPEPPDEDESPGPQDVSPLEAIDVTPLEEMEGAAEEPASKVNEGDAALGDDETEATPAVRWEEWLKRFHAGQGRPRWCTKMTAPLEEMLQADRAEERVASAQSLVPLGRADSALPVLLATVREHSELYDAAVGVLPWLLWEDRLKLFLELKDLASGQSDLSMLIRVMAQVPDPRAAGVFWELLADERLTPETASAVRVGLMAAHLGTTYYYSFDEISPLARRELVEKAKPRAEAGSELQRLTALSLLASVVPDEAAEVAAKLADDPQLSDDLRRDAFQVLLATLPRREATQRAIAAMNAGDPARRKLALVRLVEGADAIDALRGAIQFQVISDVSSGYISGAPIIPEPPAGLEARHVRPLMDDPDPKIAAYAGYLLALLGEKDGLGPLLQHWRAREEDDEKLSRLVYRAIAALNDSSQVSALEEIYGQLDEWEVGEFYWTIRIMSGPEMLRLRKKIRDEVGMSNLR